MCTRKQRRSDQPVLFSKTTAVATNQKPTKICALRLADRSLSTVCKRLAHALVLAVFSLSGVDKIGELQYVLLTIAARAECGWQPVARCNVCVLCSVCDAPFSLLQVHLCALCARERHQHDAREAHSDALRASSATAPSMRGSTTWRDSTSRGPGNCRWT